MVGEDGRGSEEVGGREDEVLVVVGKGEWRRKEEVKGKRGLCW